MSPSSAYTCAYQELFYTCIHTYVCRSVFVLIFSDEVEYEASALRE